MLKNLFLNTSAICYAPKEDGTKTEAELEREAIEVEELPPVKPKKGEEGYVEPNPDDETDIEANEEEETDEEEEDEEVEETAEAKAIREAEEAANADTKSKRQVERMQKRIDTLTAKTRTTETENAELKRLLDAKKEDGTLVLTEDEVERRAELKAQEKANDRAFEKSVKDLAMAAKAKDPDFNKNIKTVTDEVGLLPPIMVAILEDLESEHTNKKVGAEVLIHLSKNIDDYEEYFTDGKYADGSPIPISEGRMAIKLQKLANKITKKEPKAISRVPAPNEPIGGNGGKTPLNDKMSDADWIAQREAQTKGGIRAR